ncbi:MAG: hypothetical protein ACE1Y4_01670, partial [Lysobacterales bacterium]
ITRDGGDFSWLTSWRRLLAPGQLTPPAVADQFEMDPPGTELYNPQPLEGWRNQRSRYPPMDAVLRFWCFTDIGRTGTNRFFGKSNKSST